MNYKTIRYPGHCEQMRLLMNDLKLNHDRATLKRILENAVPQTLQDVVIVYVAITGTQDGQLREENYVNKIYPQVIAGRLWSAIQVTTAAGISAVVDLVLESKGRYSGFVPQEQFRLTEILANRFGRYYAPGGTKHLSGELVVAGKVGHQRRPKAVTHEHQYRRAAAPTGPRAPQPWRLVRDTWLVEHHRRCVAQCAQSRPRRPHCAGPSGECGGLRARRELGRRHRGALARGAGAQAR
jgi:hypothetical protein